MSSQLAAEDLNECYQLFLSYTYKKPCDIILPHLFYALMHTPFLFSIIWIENIQMMMIFERTAAIFLFGRYERLTKMGNCLLLVTRKFGISKTNIPVLVTCIQAAYMISLYTMLLPLITILFLTKAKKTRRSNIISMTKTSYSDEDVVLQIATCGAEAWAIYSSQLQKQWNNSTIEKFQ
ncbi:hypothetical protein DICVIV_08920 [Dictyocaulus viviparus]|uniref:Uncharacterized protein n=1 Tax=Dictyocaulus viviparus TaxID=29172 RepID=A0A0D8XMS1_DICVI|nr:hypothetical protein DICVIV_08920 [Dictyocaulus viviparus]